MTSRKRQIWTDQVVYNDDVKEQCNRSCPRCGRVYFIPKFREKTLCKSCGRYIFGDKAKQFQYDLELVMNRLDEK